MSFATLERAVLAELKQVAKNRKLRLKDIMEWSTGEVKAQEGETLYFLPDLKVWCAVKVAQQSVHPTVATVTPQKVKSDARNSG